MISSTRIIVLLFGFLNVPALISHVCSHNTLLGIKDRHNGNILFDTAGHIIHIDYGFLLGISPGGNLGFESAAFKLTGEMIELMGGAHSEAFGTFTELVVQGFLVARRMMSPILAVVSSFADSGLPCFTYKADNISALRGRFDPSVSDSIAADRMRKRVRDAAYKWTTNAYDYLQKVQNNIQ